MKTNKMLSVALAAAALVTTSASSASAAYTTVGAQSKLACPAHTNGDRDFYGYGPEINAEIILKATSTRKTMQLQMVLDMAETTGDTMAFVNRTYTLATAPTNRVFSSIWDGAQWISIVGATEIGHYSWNYTDTNDNLETDSTTNEFWLRKVEIRGDTPGNDVGYGCGNLPTDSHMMAYLNTLYIMYI